MTNPTISQYLALPDEVLAEAFSKLFNTGFGANWPPFEKANDMKFIITNKSCPACSMESWINCINFLNSKINHQ